MRSDTRYFIGFGRTCVQLGIALAAVAVLGRWLGQIPAAAAVFASPLVATGCAMWLVPGHATNDSFELAWTASRASTKLVWLAGFSLGVIAMAWAVFFVIAPL